MFSVNVSVLWLVSNVSKFIFNNTCPVVVDKIMLGAWPKMPTSTFSQSRGRMSSQQKFSVVDLCPAFYCRIIAHWRSGQEELVRS